MLHLDTHLVVWLYAGERERLSPRVAELLEAEEAVVSPVIELELEYLREVGKITESGATILKDLERRIGLVLASTPFNSVVERAVDQCWTRDPFDRLIVGQAAAEEAVLLSKDRRILANYALGVWD